MWITLFLHEFFMYNRVMSEETKQILIKRFKSFLWRIGNFAAVALLAFISENVGLFDLPLWAVSIIALLTAEGTKHLNSR